MGKAKKAVAIEFHVDDIAKALMGVMPNYWNKERLCRFIANVMIDTGTQNSTELIKRINGIQPELSYPIGMNLFVNEYTISTWDIDKDITVKEGLGQKFEDRLFISCKVIDIDIDSAKPYLINYTVITTSGEVKARECYASEDALRSPLIEI